MELAFQEPTSAKHRGGSKVFDFILRKLEEAPEGASVIVCYCLFGDLEFTRAVTKVISERQLKVTGAIGTGKVPLYHTEKKSRDDCIDAQREFERVCPAVRFYEKRGGVDPNNTHEHGDAGPTDKHVNHNKFILIGSESDAANGVILQSSLNLTAADRGKAGFVAAFSSETLFRAHLSYYAAIVQAYSTQKQRNPGYEYAGKVTDGKLAAFFLPGYGENLVVNILKRAEGGETVRIIVPKITNNGVSKKINKLMNGSVKVKIASRFGKVKDGKSYVPKISALGQYSERSGRSLHSKMILIGPTKKSSSGRKLAYFGTPNFSVEAMSTRTRWEVMIRSDDPMVYDEFRKHFSRVVKNVC